MPILPIIDLLIIVGWTSLMGGVLFKAVYLTTAYRPTFFGMGPSDFVMLAGVCMLFALTLAARTWVKYHEQRMTGAKRRVAGQGEETGEHELPAGGSGAFPDPGRASAERR